MAADIKKGYDFVSKLHHIGGSSIFCNMAFPELDWDMYGLGSRKIHITIGTLNAEITIVNKRRWKKRGGETGRHQADMETDSRAIPRFTTRILSNEGEEKPLQDVFKITMDEDKGKTTTRQIERIIEGNVRGQCNGVTELADITLGVSLVAGSWEGECAGVFEGTTIDRFQ
jgi:hypothetical protein